MSENRDYNGFIKHFCSPALVTGRNYEVMTHISFRFPSNARATCSSRIRMSRSHTCQRSLEFFFAFFPRSTQTFPGKRGICGSSEHQEDFNLRIFKTKVLGVFLHGAESWKVSQSICHKLDVFQTRYRRGILKIFWPRTISNKEFYNKTNTRPLLVEIKKEEMALGRAY